jgi:hypothetical protein
VFDVRWYVPFREPSAAPGRVRKRLSTGLRHFLRPAEVDKNNKQLHQQMSDSQASPVVTAVVDLDKNNNASGSSGIIHGSGSGHNRDRIVFTMEDDDQTEAVDEKTMIEQAASHASSSNDGLNTCLYASSDQPPRSDLYRPRADTWAGPGRRYGGNDDDDGIDDETSDEGDERDRRANGARSDEGDGDGDDEDEDEEKEGEEDVVSLSSGDSDPRSLSSIAVSIALGARDDIATEQLLHSSTATTRTTSGMDEEFEEGEEARRGEAGGDAAGAAAARRSQSLILPKRRCSNAGISTKGDQGTSQIRLLIKPSKSDPNTLAVKGAASVVVFGSGAG